MWLLDTALTQFHLILYAKYALLTLTRKLHPSRVNVFRISGLL